MGTVTHYSALMLDTQSLDLSRGTAIQSRSKANTRQCYVELIDANFIAPMARDACDAN